MGNCVD
jgi:hypothetical protein